jgi:tRNA (guanosine-2'-O-)-methyltransferase
MTDEELYQRLCAFISDNKRSLFDRIAAQRTRQVTIVLEDIYQPHNASAVVRTCDLLGIQDLHVVESRNTYTVNPDVTQGASKWVDIFRHRGGTDNSADCITMLRDSGYRIVATSPAPGACTPDDIPLDQPLAICFGTELTGLSDGMLAAADVHLRIPMYGFTESYNLSVSAAIVAYTITERLRGGAMAWQLSDAEQLALKLAWVRGMLRDAEAIEARIRDSNGPAVGGD